ncbi:Flap endonuclease 1 [Smittium mucronatum]|uniref:Flap endonuclease 1 n=1 Tax=Smittium mucronatum TaxID=133383 RepID=A0A1R0H0P0_9FUNG|nr:Flap endonuclease 1 [Smittium mucronatum]
MGIQGLTKLISDVAPHVQKQSEMKAYLGRKVAIDASMSLYQFLVAVRGQDGQNLTNDQGETTSHLVGMFYRTIRMIENGLKPLAKRTDRRNLAEKELASAKEQGDTESINKFSRRLVKVTPQHNADCKKLLSLMGVPYIDAPCEAEAMCAELAKSGHVWAAASEDMDTLCFGAPILLRRLTFSEAKKLPILEFHLDKVLQGLDLTYSQFVDLCILLGCDYTQSIKNVGPKTGYSLIKQHKDIESVIENLKANQTCPPDFDYKSARQLFLSPDVAPTADLKLVWQSPDVEGVCQFMCVENGFNRDRILKSLEKLTTGAKKAQQGRLDSFFKSVPKKIDDSSSSTKSANKRKSAPKQKPNPKKSK